MKKIVLICLAVLMILSISIEPAAAMTNSNKKEELITEKKEIAGENHTLDAEEEAPLPIKDMLVKDLDFSALDDSPTEKDGFKELKKNEPIQIKTKETDREYYHLFGAANNARTLKSFRNKERVNPDDALFKDLPDDNAKISSFISDNGGYKPSINAHSVGMLQSSLSETTAKALVTYFYDNGRVGFTDGWEIGFGVSNSELAGTDKSSNIMPLIKLFNNESTGEVLAYGILYHKMRIQGLIRMKIKPIGKKGKQNITLKFQNFGPFKSEENIKYTNIFYKVHMDIGGRHQQSKMYSFGEYKGLYFLEKNFQDRKDYMLGFTTTGYKNNPTALRGSNTPTSKAFSRDFFSAFNTIGITDPGKDKMFPYTQHPGWALRWEPQIQERNEIREASYEVDVQSKLPIAPVVEIVEHGYEKENYIVQGTWKDVDSEEVSLYYTVDDGEPQKIGDYINTELGKAFPYEIVLPAEQLRGGDHKISVYAIDDDTMKSDVKSIQLRPDMRISESVKDDKNQQITKVSPGDEISYTITGSTGYNEQDKGTITDGAIVQTYSDLLEPPEKLQVTDENGNEIGKATYDVRTKQLKAVLAANTPRNTAIMIRYQAKVKKTTPKGSVIKTQSKFNTTYSTKDKAEALSDPTELLVVGILTFESIPETFHFGTQLINTKTKRFPLKEYKPALAIKDTRGDAKRWKLNVSVSQPLTGQQTGQELHGLIYLKDKQVQEITNSSQLIETGGEGISTISNSWNEQDNGFFLEVPPGVAKSDRYQGELQWELQDTP